MTNLLKATAFVALVCFGIPSITAPQQAAAVLSEKKKLSKPTIAKSQRRNSNKLKEKAELAVTDKKASI